MEYLSGVCKFDATKRRKMQTRAHCTVWVSSRTCTGRKVGREYDDGTTLLLSSFAAIRSSPAQWGMGTLQLNSGDSLYIDRLTSRGMRPSARIRRRRPES